MSNTAKQPEAEAALLGALLLDCSKLAKVRSLVGSEAFSERRNGLIFQAICRVATRGVEVDLDSVRQELAALGTLEAAGGLNYLVHLAGDCVHNTAFVERDAGIVAEAWSQRRAIKALRESAAAVSRAIPGEGAVFTAVEDAGKRIQAVLHGSARKRRSLIPPYVPFPNHLLPAPLRGFVSVSSQAIGCDPSFVALPLLTVAGAAIGNSRWIQLKEGWEEPPIIWDACIGESGTLKSPGQGAVLRLLERLQQEDLQRHSEAMERYVIDLQCYDRDFAHWKRTEDDSPPPRRPETPVPQRYFTTDTTVEALVAILHGQPRGVLVASDELSGWINGFDQYRRGKGSDVARWLEMWGGRPLVVDRKTGPEKVMAIPRASVSVTGGIQPEVFRKATGKEHFENGLVPRLLVAYPPRSPRRWSEQVIPTSAEKDLEHLLRSLCGLELGRDEQGQPTPIFIPLSPDAKDLFAQFVNEHGEEQAALSGRLAAAWSKLEAYVARFALIDHCVLVVLGDAPESAVGAESVRRAIGLVRWLGNETRRVYSLLDADAETLRLERLASIIGAIGGEVGARDWQRKRGLKTAEEAKGELRELESAGYGALEDRPAGPKGGRPSLVFRLFPDGTDIDKTPSSGATSGESAVPDPQDRREQEEPEEFGQREAEAHG